LTLPAYVASGDVKAVVENASYNSEENIMDFECLVPVRSGEMAKYDFFWPSALPAIQTWPTQAEILAGHAGGSGIGAGATGTLPIGDTSTISGGGTVFVGGPNVVFRSNSDYGDRTPTDVGFSAQTIIPATVFADLETGSNPNPDLTLNYIDPLPAMQQPGSPAGSLVIDIRRTKVIDSDNPGVEAILASVLRGIADGDLVIDTSAKFGDGANSQPFAFEFDSEEEQFGARIAYLKD
jgi:hypothetical protein